MKTLAYYIGLFFVIILYSCTSKIEPQVDTFYYSTGNRDSLRSYALVRLYDHYVQSDKTKEYYEVVSRNTGDYIVNYYPQGQLLTICGDPGSGWSGQLRNVGLNELHKMGNSKIHIDSLSEFVLSDSTIQHNRPIQEVKTNGKPN
jgi:hypothetical protein